MPTGSEQDVLKVVGKLKKAGTADIARALGFSNAYVAQLCAYLTRKGYLKSFGKGRFTLAPKGLQTLVGDEWKLTVDRGIVEDVARQVAAEVAKKIGGTRERVIIKESAPRRRRTVYKRRPTRRKEDLSSDLSAEIRRMKAEARRAKEEETKVKIKTSFIPPIDLEDVEMETNIEKVSVAEKGKFDLGGAVEALKKVKK